MKNRIGIVCLLILFAQAPASANGTASLSVMASSIAFEEKVCVLDDDNEPDIVRIYQSQAKNADGAFDSLAIVCLRKKGQIVPMHSFRYEGDFPNMLRVSPFDLDDDGISEFIVETFSAGASHTYRKVRVIRLVLTNDNTILEDVRFVRELEDRPEDLQIEKHGGKGQYQLMIGSQAFRLTDGREDKAE